MEKINIVGKEARKISPEEFAKALGAEIIGEKKNMDVIDLMSFDYTKLNPKADAEPRLEEKGLVPKKQESKELFVLNHYNPYDHLIGIFTTKRKASKAAMWHMSYFYPGKEVIVEEANGETLYSVDEGSHVIHITKWIADSAIMPNGEWGEP